ncbi:MAG: hypothetical protein J1E29_03640, partial [Duncaniella sp.]|nr:hypothetical protein [Duncaniella sp.]
SLNTLQMKKLTTALSLLIALTLFAGLQSCGSREKGDILKYVPADADLVAIINANSIAREFGVSFTRDGADYNPAISDKISPKQKELLSLIGSLHGHGVADVEKVVFFSPDYDDFYYTFNINEFEGFREVCDEYVAWEADSEGLHVGTTKHNMSVLASDSQVWLGYGIYASDVRKLVEKAHKNPLSALKGIKEALTAEGQIRVARLSEKVDDNKDTKSALQSVWDVYTITTPSEKLAVKGERLRADGEKLEYTGLQNIDPSVLSYASDDPAIALAFGVTPEFNWNTVLNLLPGTSDFQVQAIISMVIPYLQSINGTVMLTATPANTDAFTDPEPGNWRVLLMAKLPKEKIDEALSTVRTLCFTTGLRPETDPATGMLTIRQYGLNISIGNIDGYLTITNGHLSAAGGSALSKAFGGKFGGVQLNVPSLAPIGPGLPDCGLKTNLTLSATRMDAEITLPGTTGPVLLNLLSFQ